MYKIYIYIYVYIYAYMYIYIYIYIYYSVSLSKKPLSSLAHLLLVEAGNAGYIHLYNH
jgi:hypothetical protein